jgi:phosphohistidine swiveling domain-containing protein
MTLGVRSVLVADLARLGAKDLDRGGGKAANLGELLRTGFPVPPGFVITTTAYDLVVKCNHFNLDLVDALSRGNPAQARTGLEEATIPAEVERAILEAYRRTGSGSVAVRSSATAEDLPQAAFAGQQETFLGVSGEQALLDAVRCCWASLWSERAVFYREQHGLSQAPVKLAVIVQRMIAADVAGVMFTANPVTGARDETIVEASAGLGEALVSGLVTPDHFVLRNTRHRWQIVERRLGRQEVEVRPRTSGGVEQVAGAKVSKPVLPVTDLLQLTRMGASIARHFGRPQDIEWAWADGKLSILQSRPITALPPAPHHAGRFEPQRFAGDYLQVRPYPLDMTTWLPAVANALPRMLPVDSVMPSFARMWIENDGVVERLANVPGIRPTPELLLAPGRIIALARRFDPARWRDDLLLVAMLSAVHRLESRDLRALSWTELLDTAREAMAMPLVIMEVRRRYFPRGVLALGALWLMSRVFHLGDRFAPLLSGVDNRTLEANRALEALAAEIRNDPELAVLFSRHDAEHLLAALRQVATGHAFLERFMAFLDSYGHRETGSPLLVSQPTWKDSPQIVLGILKGMARTELASRQLSSDWMAARDELLAQPALRWWPLRRFVLGLIAEARRVSALREDTHYAMTLPMPILRQTLLELGRRLATVGILESAADVFHLRFDELEQIGDVWPPPGDLAEELRQAERRRAGRRLELERTGTPLVELPSLSRPQPGGNVLVAGTPGSPGVAEGPVRVVREPAAFGSLRPGEVLVAPYTNPSWTPLFTRAAAVVVDTGASMSHAAIVAREYGVPAVMGTGDGTRRLTDGQWVLVNGSRGQVLAVSAPGEDASSGVTVDADCKDQDGSGGDRLPERGDSVEVERVRDETEQKDAENRAGHPTPAAAE